MQEFAVTSRTWRIHKDNINFFPLCCHTFHKPAGIPRNKTDIPDPVLPGIHSGITDGVSVQLHANDIPGISGSNDPNGTCTTVGIDHPLFTCHCRKLHGLSVKNFRLHRIYLIKRRRGNTEAQSHKTVFDKSRSVKYNIPVSENHAGLSVIDIEDHCCDLRMLLAESLYKVILGWKDR